MTITWTNTSGGNWSTASNWSSNPSLPGPSDDVAITLPGSYTVNLNVSPTIASLTLDDAQATLALNLPVDLSAGTLAVDAGLIAFNFGTISNGTVVVNGGSIAFGGAGPHALDDVVWQGQFAPDDHLVTVEGPFSVQSLGGGAGTMVLNNTTLDFLNAVTMDSVTINLSGGGPEIDVGQGFITPTATFGPSVTLNAQAGSDTDIGLAGTLVSEGTITVATSALLSIVGTGQFTNSGAVTLAAGGTLAIGTTNFANAGAITFAAGGLLEVNDTLSTGSLGTLAGAGGILQIGSLGMLTNAGQTLSIGSSLPLGGLALANQGVIQGGTITNQSGTTTFGGTLSGVTWVGPLDIAAGNTLHVVGGISIEAAGSGIGTATIAGVLDLPGSQTMNGANLSLSGQISAGTLTLGASATLTSDSTVAMVNATALTNLGTMSAAPGTSLTLTGSASTSFPPTILSAFTNEGTARAIGSGSTISILGTAGVNDGVLEIGAGATLSLGDTSFVNAGTILFDDPTGVLNVTGTTTLSALGTVVNTGGLIDVTGFLDDAGGTLTLAPGSAFGHLRVGAPSFLGGIIGGTIVAAGGSADFPAAGLYDVAWRGPVDLTSPDQSLAFNSTTSLDLHAIGGGEAQIELTGAHNDLSFSGGTLDAMVTLGAAGASVTFGGAGLLSDSGNLTLAATTTLATSIGSGNIILDGNITNLGLIDGEFGTFYVGAFSSIPGIVVTPTTFDNQGTIIADAAAPFIVGDLTTFDNTGTIQLGTGTIDFSGTIANAGTLAFTGASGTLQFDQPGSITATIDGWIAGDTVALTQPGSYALGFASGTLDVLQTGTQVAAFNVGTGYSLSSFSLDTSSGGALIGIACFARGTRIATPHGERAVQHLAPGDLVRLACGATAPILRIVCRRIDPAPPALHPVRIRRGAFGHGRPHRDLFLSPDHALYLDGALIPVRHLIDAAAIARVPRRAIDYFHVELPRHDVILAEGLPVESYLAAGAEAARSWEAHGYAPLMVSGAAIDQARARINLSASA